ncbi:MAG: hypothetical protein ACRC20_10670 [Segniliparus sp.]|uniref:hypothetical protein n=1 Tax=Segniliparus sp. TaxID=2804064 RepID=UPI003F3E52F6
MFTGLMTASGVCMAWASARSSPLMNAAARSQRAAWRQRSEKACSKAARMWLG